MVFNKRPRIANKQNRLGNLTNDNCNSSVTKPSNKVAQQQRTVESSRCLNGLQEDQLDFEPEAPDIDDQDPIFSDQSTVRIVDSSDTGELTVHFDTNSLSSVSYQDEMLPVMESDAEDGRQDDYLFLRPNSNGSTHIDSSSSSVISISDEEHHVNNTLNFDDDNESAYNLTQEQEQKLLDDEDERDTQTSVDEESVEVCLIGNSRITLPKLLNNQFNIEQKHLKRQTNISIQNTCQNKKKRKWDRTISDLEQVRVLLNDIGYDPFYSVNTSSEIDTNPVGHSADTDNEININKECISITKSLIITCKENEKRVCQQIQKCRESSLSPRSTDGTFKLPLAPAKRPPTRPKRTDGNSNDGTKSVNNMQKDDKLVNLCQSQGELAIVTSLNPNNTITATAEDDIISILASTLDGDNTEVDVPNSSIKEEPFSFNNIENGKNGGNFESQPQDHILEERRRAVENWVQNVPSPSECHRTVPQPHNHEPPLQSPTMSPSVGSEGRPRVLFKDIPNVFGGLCFYHYFNGICVRRQRCKNMHSVLRDKYIKKLSDCSTEELLKAYQFLLKFENLYKEMYPSFIMAFGALRMQKELVTCITDIFKINGVNTSEAMELVVKALEQCGFSFLEAVEKISYNVGFLQFPVLADILLDMITRKPDILKYWEVIKRFAKAVDKVPPQIVKRILNKAMSDYPLNRSLCIEIYNVIIKNNTADLSQIEECLTAIKTLAAFGDNSGGTAPSVTRISSPVATLPLVHSPTSTKQSESLFTQIESNTIKERERFEMLVPSRTNQPTSHPQESVPNLNGNVNLNQNLENCYVRSYNYGTGVIAPHYESSSSESEDRYLNPSTPSLTSPDSFIQSAVNTHINTYELSQSLNPIGCIIRNSPNYNSNSSFDQSEVNRYVPEMYEVRNMRRDVDQALSYIPPEQVYLPKPVTLTPDRPIFGNAKYRAESDFNSSLHNLLPNIMEHVSINEADVVKLNTAIKKRDGAAFLALLKYYKKPPTVQNFITMTIAHLKTLNNLYENFMALHESIAMVMPNYATDEHIKAIFEVIIMNLLLEFEKKGNWHAARKLLEKFCDWDSLVSSQLLQIFNPRKITHMGRYIYLARILGQGKNFHYTHEILQCPKLHLLESCDSWPYFYNAQVDIHSRNIVLTDFFKVGYHFSIVDVSDMYRKIYKYGRIIHGYDASLHFNPMLISLINDQDISRLKHFLADIELFAKHMEKNVLRAFAAMLEYQLSDDLKFKLYELCCDKQIYTNFVGNERRITVRTNMLDSELSLTLSYYFCKLKKASNLLSGNVTIEIALPKGNVLYPKIIQKCVRSIKEVNDQVRKILKDTYNIVVVTNAKEVKSTIIEISEIQINNWLKVNSLW